MVRSVEVEIPYLQPAGGGAHIYRRRVPDDVRKDVGKWEWRYRFRPGTPKSVLSATCERLARDNDREIAKFRSGEPSEHDKRRLETAAKGIRERDGEAREVAHAFHYLDATARGMAAEFEETLLHGGQYQEKHLRLSLVYEHDKATRGRPRKSEASFKRSVDRFIAEVGDLDVRQIRFSAVEDWLAAMKPGTKARGLKAPSVEKHRSNLHAVVARAYRRHEITRPNPFAGHKIDGASGSARDRLPFNREMINRVDEHLAANKRLGAETRNILRIMRNTGAGPAEIGGTVLADWILDADVPHIVIRPNVLRGLKVEDEDDEGAVRERSVPLIGVALDAAHDAVRRARRKGKPADEVQVFPGFGGGPDGRGADSISAKLNKAIRAAGVPKSPRLVAYSYRHTIKEALRAAGVAEHVQRRLLGHSGRHGADNYGSPATRFKEVHAALAKALECLGDVEPSIYSKKERV
jgi:integrase